ncbi:MAG TPA: TPM domain-containing protein [Myxococcaceae bacterium]|nr:TPM domain-containing protein [Myxococcaceae bacterium]
MRFAPFALFAWLALAPVALAVTVHEVPDVRPRSAVVDLTGTLSTGDKTLIDAAAERGRSGGELYVAVIDTTGGEPHRDYATRLFNQLRLDTGARNRGILLMAALNDRKAEIIIGDGYAGWATSETDRIMSDVVVAHFRRGDPAGAMVNGARALVDQVLLASGSAMRSSQSRSWSSSPGQPEGMGHQVKSAVGSHPLPFWGGLGGVGLLAFAGARRYLRNRPRACSRCSQQMVRLGEHADDAHLTSGERKEESLGSVDYDIWSCTSCRNTLKLRYGAFFTGYSKCTRCRAKTLDTDTTTLEHATEYSTGRARVDENCRHCDYHNSYTRTIPRKTRSTSSSSSSSSSRGGGSSSGRGSSGSW